MLELIDLPDLADRHTSTLSGGQARRVSLARHLITKPSVLLMDEPFTALDSETQSALSQRVHTFLTTHNITVLVSTHLGFDVEAFADTIIDLASICEQR
jgi:iron(III) transport system ATP-binding protein